MSAPLRIALAFPGCHRRGGVERVVFECARYLAKRGHAVSVFAREWEPTSESLPLRYEKVATPSRPAFREGRAFFDACTARLQPEAFDAYGSHGCVCPLDGVYWAHSVHRAWLEHAKAFRPWSSIARWKQTLNPAHRVLLDLEERHLRARRYRRVVALTSQVREDLHTFYGVPASDVEVNPIGFDPEHLNPASAAAIRPEIRRRLSYAEEDRVVLFVANESERKGLRPLLQAVARLDQPRVKVLIAGKIDAPAHASLVRQLGLGERVRFLGATDRVAELYAAADIFALPTQYEAWGLVIVEALACGRPVLTSQLAGAAGMIREGLNGALLDNPAAPSEIAARLEPLLSGRHAAPEAIAATVESLTWDRVLGAYESTLLRTVTQPV